MKVVVAFGTFDLLHPGHLAYLRQAKTYGDRLIVVISRDVNVVKIKGGKPLFSEQDRKKIVGALKDVDEAVLGSSADMFKIIKKLKPDIVCLGYDQEIGKAELQSKLSGMEAPPRIVRAKSYHAENYKSSKLKK